MEREGRMERGLLPTATADKGRGASARAAADTRVARMHEHGREEGGGWGGRDGGGEEGGMGPCPLGREARLSANGL